MDKTWSTSQDVRSYCLRGMNLKVGGEDAVLVEQVEKILAPFAGPEIADGPFELGLSWGNPDQIGREHPGLREIWNGLLPAGVPAVYYAGPESTHIHLPGRAWTQINMARKEARIIAKRGEQHCLGYGCITPVLFEFLSQVGHHGFHAAALCIEQGAERRAILVVGPSGSGKTTAALALAREGMVLMADDTSFTGRDDGDPDESVVVWGLPRPCKVHSDTLAMMPHLAELPRRPSVKKSKELIDIKDITGRYSCQTARPGLILFLSRRNQGEHRLEPLGKVQALTELASQNVRASKGHTRGRADGAFRTLGKLVAQSDTYQLSVGPQLETLGREVAPLLKA